MGTAERRVPVACMSLCIACGIVRGLPYSLDQRVMLILQSAASTTLLSVYVILQLCNISPNVLNRTTCNQ
jgi:hypothetical protein